MDLALRYAEAGAERLHIVDLDADRSGAGGHEALIRRIVDSAPVPVQVCLAAGGQDAVERWLDAGVGRVALGGRTAPSPRLVLACLARWPGRILVRVALRGGLAAVARTDGGAGLMPLARYVRSFDDSRLAGTVLGVADGSGPGARRSAISTAARGLSAETCAEGVVARRGDVAALRASGPVAAAILGAPLHRGAMTLSDALAEAADPPSRDPRSHGAPSG